jgi:hypothetical protein
MSKRNGRCGTFHAGSTVVDVIGLQYRKPWVLIELLVKWYSLRNRTIIEGVSLRFALWIVWWSLS